MLMAFSYRVWWQLVVNVFHLLPIFFDIDDDSYSHLWVVKGIIANGKLWHSIGTFLILLRISLKNNSYCLTMTCRLQSLSLASSCRSSGPLTLLLRMVHPMTHSVTLWVTSLCRIQMGLQLIKSTKQSHNDCSYEL